MEHGYLPPLVHHSQYRTLLGSQDPGVETGTLGTGQRVTWAFRGAVRRMFPESAPSAFPSVLAPALGQGATAAAADVPAVPASSVGCGSGRRTQRAVV